MRVTVTKREAHALDHWRKCEGCRESKEGAIDEAVGCLSIPFAPIDARMDELQQEFAALQAEKRRLVMAPIPKELKGESLE